MSNDTEIKDVELVVGALENSEEFSKIIDRYESRLERYVRGISGARNEDVQDILQDIFLSTYQNLKGYNPSMKFSSWIYRIAHNKTISWWRKNKRALDGVSIDDHEDFISSLYNSNSVQEKIDREHTSEAIEYALSHIKPQYRQLLLLAYWESKSYKEIAEITRSSTGTVGTRLKRARTQFNKVIKTYGL